MRELQLWNAIVTVSLTLLSFVSADLIVDPEELARYTIEGKVYSPEIYMADSDWQKNVVVSINGGEYQGFLKEDGTFILSGIPVGSYVVDIVNSDYVYESVRVEINTKGKFRARKLSYVQPSQIVQVPYPLKLKALTRFRYFQQREQWKITDFLFSPMVLMMLLPLLLMLILPKMMSDPETKKEMEQLNISKMTSEMPDMSEMITNFLSGGASTSAAKDKEKSKLAAKQSKKRSQQ